MEPRFIKEQEASEILSNLGLRTPLGKIYLVGPFSILRVLTS